MNTFVEIKPCIRSCATTRSSSQRAMQRGPPQPRPSCFMPSRSIHAFGVLLSLYQGHARNRTPRGTNSPNVKDPNDAEEPAAAKTLLLRALEVYSHLVGLYQTGVHIARDRTLRVTNPPNVKDADHSVPSRSIHTFGVLLGLYL